MSEESFTLVVGVVVLIVFLGFGFFFVFKLMPRMLRTAFELGGTPFGGGFNLSQVTRGGGWSKLAESWQTSAPPPVRLVKRQSVRVGAVIYRRSTTIGASEDGLYLETSGFSSLFGLPPLLIPWSAILDHRPARLYSMPAVQLNPAPPADIPIVFYQSILGKLGMPIEKEERP